MLQMLIKGKKWPRKGKKLSKKGDFFISTGSNLRGSTTQMELHLCNFSAPVSDASRLLRLPRLARPPQRLPPVGALC